METLACLVLGYFAIGAACFSHPRSPAEPNDFHWYNQIAVFRDSLPDVLTWPLGLWRFALIYSGRN